MKLLLIVPCFNEQAIIDRSFHHLYASLERLGISDTCDILYVDDGSTDQTWGCITRLSREHANVRGIKLEQNSGHQAAIYAGYTYQVSNAYDASICLDCDLQDDLSCIARMLDARSQGYHVVVGVRSSRQSDRRSKRLPASLYYRSLAACGARSIPNSGDFRLMSFDAAEALVSSRPVTLYLRSQVLNLGYSFITVDYARVQGLSDERPSRYTLRKMIRLAHTGVRESVNTSLLVINSIAVLYLVFLLAYILHISFEIGVNHKAPLPGWTSIIMVVATSNLTLLMSLLANTRLLHRVNSRIAPSPFFIIRESV